MSKDPPDFLFSPNGVSEADSQSLPNNPLLMPLDGSYVQQILLKFQDTTSYLSNDNSKSFVGKVYAMCSMKEHNQKVQMNTANDLERDSDREVNPKLTLKSFQRSDAFRTFKPEDVRPCFWCRRTVYYALCYFADCDIVKKPYLMDKNFTFLDIYNFLRDRLRSIWQDLTVQRCTRHRGYIECFEISIRFLIYSNEVLCENEEYDVAQNTLLLNTCLDKLMDGYSDVRATLNKVTPNESINQMIRNDPNFTLVMNVLTFVSAHEPEFWSYRLLLLIPQLLTPGCSATFCDICQRMPDQIKNSDLVRFSISACLAATSGNIYLYFKLMNSNECHPLQAALMNRFAGCIRVRFLYNLVDNKIVKDATNPLNFDTLKVLLGYEQEPDHKMLSFLQKYGINTSRNDSYLALETANMEMLAHDDALLAKTAGKTQITSSVVNQKFSGFKYRQLIFDPDFKAPFMSTDGLTTGVPSYGGYGSSSTTLGFGGSVNQLSSTPSPTFGTAAATGTLTGTAAASSTNLFSPSPSSTVFTSTVHQGQQTSLTTPTDSNLFRADTPGASTTSTHFPMTTPSFNQGSGFQFQTTQQNYQNLVSGSFPGVMPSSNMNLVDQFYGHNYVSDLMKKYDSRKVKIYKPTLNYNAPDLHFKEVSLEHLKPLNDLSKQIMNRLMNTGVTGQMYRDNYYNGYNNNYNNYYSNNNRENQKDQKEMEVNGDYKHREDDKEKHKKRRRRMDVEEGDEDQEALDMSRKRVSRDERTEGNEWNTRNERYERDKRNEMNENKYRKDRDEKIKERREGKEGNLESLVEEPLKYGFERFEYDRMPPELEMMKNDKNYVYLSINASLYYLEHEFNRYFNNKMSKYILYSLYICSKCSKSKDRSDLLLKKMVKRFKVTKCGVAKVFRRVTQLFRNNNNRNRSISKNISRSKSSKKVNMEFNVKEIKRKLKVKMNMNMRLNKNLKLKIKIKIKNTLKTTLRLMMNKMYNNFKNKNIKSNFNFVKGYLEDKLLELFARSRSRLRLGRLGGMGSREMNSKGGWNSKWNQSHGYDSNEDSKVSVLNSILSFTYENMETVVSNSDAQMALFPLKTLEYMGDRDNYNNYTSNNRNRENKYNKENKEDRRDNENEYCSNYYNNYNYYNNNNPNVWGSGIFVHLNFFDFNSNNTSYLTSDRLGNGLLEFKEHVGEYMNSDYCLNLKLDILNMCGFALNKQDLLPSSEKCSKTMFQLMSCEIPYVRNDNNYYNNRNKDNYNNNNKLKENRTDNEKESRTRVDLVPFSLNVSMNLRNESCLTRVKFNERFDLNSELDSNLNKNLDLDFDFDLNRNRNMNMNMTKSYMNHFVDDFCVYRNKIGRNDGRYNNQPQIAVFACSKTFKLGDDDFLYKMYSSKKNFNVLKFRDKLSLVDSLSLLSYVLNNKSTSVYHNNFNNYSSNNRNTDKQNDNKEKEDRTTVDLSDSGESPVLSNSDNSPRLVDSPRSPKRKRMTKNQKTKTLNRLDELKESNGMNGFKDFKDLNKLNRLNESQSEYLNSNVCCLVCYRLSVSKLDILTLYKLSNKLNEFRCPHKSPNQVKRRLNTLLSVVNKALMDSLVEQANGFNLEDSEVLLRNSVRFACVGFEYEEDQEKDQDEEYGDKEGEEKKENNRNRGKDNRNKDYKDYKNENTNGKNNYYTCKSYYVEPETNEVLISRLLFPDGLRAGFDEVCELVLKGGRLKVLERPVNLPDLRRFLVNLLLSDGVSYLEIQRNLQGILSNSIQRFINSVILNFPESLWEMYNKSASVYHNFNNRNNYADYSNRNKDKEEKGKENEMGVSGEYCKNSFIAMLVNLKEHIKATQYTLSSLGCENIDMNEMVEKYSNGNELSEKEVEKLVLEEYLLRFFSKVLECYKIHKFLVPYSVAFYMENMN